MIDHEIEVYDAVVTALREAFPDLYCASEYVAQPPQLPAFALMQMDNPIVLRARDFMHVENATRPMFEMNVYSNRQAGKKTECKRIAAVASDALAALGFTRTFLQPIPNMADATIYRIVGRFTATIV